MISVDVELNVEAKRKSEEDQVHQIICTSLSELQSNGQDFNKAINFNEENPGSL